VSARRDRARPEMTGEEIGSGSGADAGRNSEHAG
jgi:hypothetical protein